MQIRDIGRSRSISAFTRFLDDGRSCLTNAAAERALRGIALGRRAWLFGGSDRGGERAAARYTVIATAKLNGIDPQAWLADALARIADQPASRVHELLPRHWKRLADQAVATWSFNLPRCWADAYDIIGVPSEERQRNAFPVYSDSEIGKKRLLPVMQISVAFSTDRETHSRWRK